MAKLQTIIVFHGRHLGICNQMCQTSTTDVRCHYAQLSEQKRNLYTNKWPSYNQLVFHGRHVVRHLRIYNLICVKLIQLMCAVNTHNSVKKNEVFILING